MFTAIEDGMVGFTIPNEVCIKFAGFSYDYLKDLKTIYDTIDREYCTTVLLLGDDNPVYINFLASCIKDLYDVKVAWFSEKSSIDCRIQKHVFNYIKIGPYVKYRGDLYTKTTNQRLFKIKHGKLIDITNRCW